LLTRKTTESGFSSFRDERVDRLGGVKVEGIVITRRGALVSFSAVAAAALSGCNTTQAPLVQTGAAPAAVSGYRIDNIAVDTAPLLAQSGNPTAQWAQDALPGALSQAFASHMTPGDPSGGTLSVRIDSIYLGGGGPADPDIMKGVATLSGRQVSLRATSTYISNPTDQALPEQALHGRVTALSQAFAYLLAKRLRR
jgi:hypothetical protein